MISRGTTLAELIDLGRHSRKCRRSFAFVVGIDKYDNLSPQQQLQRAVNDARSVSAAFASLGFEVVSAENVGRRAFNAQWQKYRPLGVRQSHGNLENED